LSGLRRLRRCLRWSGGGRRCLDRCIDVGLEARNHCVHRDGLAFLDQDLGEYAGAHGLHFGVDLVGGNLEDRLVALDRITNLLEPFCQRAFGERFAHRGHENVYAGHAL
jgi:hypothetical protein